MWGFDKNLKTWCAMCVGKGVLSKIVEILANKQKFIGQKFLGLSIFFTILFQSSQIKSHKFASFVFN